MKEVSAAARAVLDEASRRCGGDKSAVCGLLFEVVLEFVLASPNPERVLAAFIESLQGALQAGRAAVAAAKAKETV